MLKVNQLCKTYVHHPVLKNITFDLKMGSITAILGPSGSGKSTLLRCLSRLEKIEGGSLVLQGKDISSLPLCATGMVFQGFHLFPHMTILQNLIHAPLCLKRLSKDEAEQKAEKWLQTFNLNNKASQFPHQLSGGQKQRVAIARTMMMDPSLIMFDEPTSALDPEMVTEVGILIRSLKSPDRLILMATHELRLANLAADQILFLDQGVLVENRDKPSFFDQPATPRAQLFLKNLSTF